METHLMVIIISMFVYRKFYTYQVFATKFTLVCYKLITQNVIRFYR